MEELSLHQYMCMMKLEQNLEWNCHPAPQKGTRVAVTQDQKQTLTVTAVKVQMMTGSQQGG